MSCYLSLQRRSSSLLLFSLLSLTLVQTLGQQLGVLGSSVSLLLGVVDLLGLQSSLSLQGLRSHQSLDLGGVGVHLAVLLHGGSNDVVSDVVLLGQTKELSDVVCSLRTQSLWSSHVSQALDVGVALLDHGQSNHGQVLVDDTSSDRLSLSLSGSSWSVTRVALGQQQSNSGGVQHSLLHWEPLLVVTAGDLEDVALELVSDRLSVDFLAHALVVEGTQLVFVLDLNALLSTVGWVRNV